MGHRALSPCELAARRLNMAAAHVRRTRCRGSDHFADDLAAIPRCIDALYEGVGAVPTDQARPVVDALVSLDRELHALAVDLAAERPKRISVRERSSQPKPQKA